MINKNILVIGGAGYIGSHMVKLLKDKNYVPIVIDDLSSGYEDSLFGAELIRGNFGNSDLLNSILSTKKIDAVMHFAAVAYVGESTLDPLKYNLSSHCFCSLHLCEIGVFVWLISSPFLYL